MKPFLFVLALLFSSISLAQDSTTVTVESPIIVAKLNYGKTLKLGDVELKFVKVLSDSRCPKNVTCIWAGKAVALVDVFKNGKKVDQKEITFHPGSFVDKELMMLFSSKNTQISGVDLLPYPNQTGQAAHQDYYLQLNISN